MNLAGAFSFHSPRERVFAAMCDPSVLMAVIPGCETVEQVSSDEYVGRIVLRLPGAVGSYRTHVRLVDTTAPERSGLDGRVDGSMGSITGHAEFVLAEADGGTAMTWRGTATILGPLARLDSGFAERLAESLIGQGLKALDQRLATEVPQ